MLPKNQNSTPKNLPQCFWNRVLFHLLEVLKVFTSIMDQNARNEAFSIPLLGISRCPLLATLPFQWTLAMNLAVALECHWARTINNHNVIPLCSLIQIVKFIQVLGKFLRMYSIFFFVYQGFCFNKNSQVFNHNGT